MLGWVVVIGDRRLEWVVREVTVSHLNSRQPSVVCVNRRTFNDVPQSRTSVVLSRLVDHGAYNRFHCQ